METEGKQYTLFIKGSKLLKKRHLKYLESKVHIIFEIDNPMTWPDEIRHSTIVWFSNGFDVLGFNKYRASLHYVLVSHMLIGMVMADKEYLPIIMAYSRALDPYTFRTYTDPAKAAAENKDVTHWISKPVLATQGKGITFLTMDELKLARSQSPSQPDLYIYQPYLKNPYLFSEDVCSGTLAKFAGHKFDLRVYAILTQECELVVYKRFFARFSKHKFDLGDFKNADIHLTNTHVQRKTKITGWEDPRDVIMRYDTFRKLFGEDETDMLGHGINNIIGNAVDSVVYNTHRLKSWQTYGYNPKFYQNHFYSGKGFMLLGVDIMIDSGRKPMLIEINVSPDTDGMEDEFFETAWNLTAGRRMVRVADMPPLSENFGHLKTYTMPEGVSHGLIKKQWMEEFRYPKVEIPANRRKPSTRGKW